MFSTLKEIILANFTRLPSFWSYGLHDLGKRNRDTVLGWFWIFARPLIYILAFGMALEIGFRHSDSLNSTKPYLLWLASGIYPWFFIGDIFGRSANAFKAQSKLIKLNCFPLASIPSVNLMSNLIVFLVTFAAMMLVAVPFGAYPSIYWLQVPLIIALMLLFYYCFSLMVSCFSALSHDFANLVKVLSTPMFWLSGILFDTSHISNVAVKVFLIINPVTFLVTAFRDAVYFGRWTFVDLGRLLPFLLVVLITTLMAWRNYHALKSEVLDAI
ncbi:MAG: ABC transporter permease [Actinomycetia bacterium]|nr:ABC transporter permease [Actinomycetes bacterium]